MTEIRLLIDNNLPPALAGNLRNLGVPTEHVREALTATTEDEEIAQHALLTGATVVTADNDFPEMLAHSGALGPSIIILLRGRVPSRPEQQSVLLYNQLDRLREDLAEGAVVVIDPPQIRIRRLPLGS